MKSETNKTWNYFLLELYLETKLFQSGAQWISLFLNIQFVARLLCMHIAIYASFWMDNKTSAIAVYVPLYNLNMKLLTTQSATQTPIRILINHYIFYSNTQEPNVKNKYITCLFCILKKKFFTFISTSEYVYFDGVENLRNFSSDLFNRIIIRLSWLIALCKWMRIEMLLWIYTALNVFEMNIRSIYFPLKFNFNDLFFDFVMRGKSKASSVI